MGAAAVAPDRVRRGLWGVIAPGQGVQIQQGDGSYALKWVKGSDRGSYTTSTTVEEGAARCQGKVPANSVMAGSGVARTAVGVLWRPGTLSPS